MDSLRHALMVSRQHARLFAQDGVWWVEDLGSQNGIALNGRRLRRRRPRALSEGDRLAFGSDKPPCATDVFYRFQLEDTER